jgi:hypothetical protein
MISLTNDILILKLFNCYQADSFPFLMLMTQDAVKDIE